MKSSKIILILAALCLPISAQQKVSDRTSLAAAALAPATDILPIVDISAGLSGSKKITIDELFTGWGMTASGAALAKAANAAAQRAALGLGTAATAASTAFEPALGNPAADGYVLSSTAAGVRSWIEPASGGGSVVVADETDIEVGTDNTKVMTPLRTHQTLAYFGMTDGGFGTPNFNSGLNAFSVAATTVGTDDLNVAEEANLPGDTTIAISGAATNDLYFRNALGNMDRLPIGTDGQVLKVASGNLSWGAAAGGGGDLLAANNLSDLANAATARTNLGLGSASVVNFAQLTTSGYIWANGDMQTDGTLYVGSDLLVGGTIQAAINNITGFQLASSSNPPNNIVGLSIITPDTYAVSRSNIDIVLSPAGTGSLLAHSPDSTATGGNKRGTNAVDWQQVRSTNTMVASGTRSTISGGQNNSATQDFCVVGGGSTNNCRGNNSVIGGGSGNSTAASQVSQTIPGGSSNQTTQPYATVGGGRTNTASGQDATVVGGGSNDATGAASVAGGWDNTASGTSATSFGWGNVASGNYTTALGFNSTTRNTNAASSQAGGMFAVVGDAQAGVYVLRKSTANATSTELNTDGASGRIVLPNNSTYSFTGQVAARSSGGDSAAWRFTGTIERGANAAATALVGTPTLTDTNAEAGASTWTIAISADTTNGALIITATGAAATNIRWVAQVETAEVVY